MTLFVFLIWVRSKRRIRYINKGNSIFSGTIWLTFTIVAISSFHLGPGIFCQNPALHQWHTLDRLTFTKAGLILELTSKVQRDKRSGLFISLNISNFVYISKWAFFFFFRFFFLFVVVITRNRHNVSSGFVWLYSSVSSWVYFGFYFRSAIGVVTIVLIIFCYPSLQCDQVVLCFLHLRITLKIVQ